ncbi:MAG: hypothetical protein QOH71_2084 [Blastocatellia bacterium]|jgi:hypothetical protein|nr:hypothetical protein [Blastocatellia bacterium]
MNRLHRTGGFRVLGSLLLLLLLLAVAYRPHAQANSSQPDDGPKCDDVVASCKSPVKYLGESRGCSCFACEYGLRTQTILCTSKEEEKNKFRAMLPKARRLRM